MQFFWYAVSLAGTPELWFLVALLLPLGLKLSKRRLPGKVIRHHREFVRLFFLSVVPVILISMLLKPVMAVPRPCVPCTSPAMSACNPYCPAGLLDDFSRSTFIGKILFLPNLASSYSFPSSHSAAIFVVFAVLYIRAKNKKYLPLFIIPILVSLSRFYLGVHTPADILGGAILGLSIPFLVSALLEKQKSI